MFRKFVMICECTPLTSRNPLLDVDNEMWAMGSLLWLAVHTQFHEILSVSVYRPCPDASDWISGRKGTHFSHMDLSELQSPVTLGLSSLRLLMATSELSCLNCTVLSFLSVVPWRNPKSKLQCKRRRVGVQGKSGEVSESLFLSSKVPRFRCSPWLRVMRKC